MKELQLYTIMPLFEAHVTEICEDIKRQYEDGIANCALFSMTLVPEGTPPVNKAEALCKKYDLFKAKLDSMGLCSGILVQATIGHGRILGESSPFQKFEGLVPGNNSDTCCPYDDAFCDHIRDVFITVASHKPDTVMVDDDFRLLARRGHGCACPLHMAEFNKRAGTNFTKEELYEELKRCGDGKYAEIFIETQRESLLKAARAMREGIDRVNPKLPATYCGCGENLEFAEEIAKILAGEGNPVVVRINNGNYTPAGARHLSSVSYRAAREAEYIRDKVDVILAETDTCPQNRYSTGAYSLHSHFTATILEGAKGAKHWITRLGAYEPKSGEAYRKLLSKNRGFYDALAEIEPQLRWLGCRIPLTATRRFIFENDGWLDRDGTDGWSHHVLERFGLPLYFSSKQGGAAFLSASADKKFSDAEILDMLRGPVFLSSDSAENLIKRGFGKYLGVDVREWQGKRPTGERLHVNGKSCNAQIGWRELVPLSDSVKIESTVYHSIDKVNFEDLFPGVTVYKNELGGTAVVFCGTPITEFTYLQAFSFLNESRKLQLVKILTECGVLPIYYNSDEEVYLRAARMKDGNMFLTLFNIGLDPIEEIELVCLEEVKSVMLLSADGEWHSAEFETDGERLTVKVPIYTLNPVAVILKK